MTFEDLIIKTKKELEVVFQACAAPELNALVDREYDGYNLTPMAALLGIRKFRKGFFDPQGHLAGSEELEGYNVPVFQTAFHERWMAKPCEENPHRFGFYTVRPAEREDIDNAYPKALLLNYGRSPRNPWFRVERALRDYLVAVNPGDPDVLLGKAYIAVGSLRVFSNFFALRRVPNTG